MMSGPAMKKSESTPIAARRPKYSIRAPPRKVPGCQEGRESRSAGRQALGQAGREASRSTRPQPGSWLQGPNRSQAHHSTKLGCRHDGLGCPVADAQCIPDVQQRAALPYGRGQQQGRACSLYWSSRPRWLSRNSRLYKDMPATSHIWNHKLMRSTHNEAQVISAPRRAGQGRVVAAMAPNRQRWRGLAINRQLLDPPYPNRKPAMDAKAATSHSMAPGWQGAAAVNAGCT